MTLLLGAGLVLILGALAPAVWLGVRGSALERLVGLQMAGAVLVPVLLLLTYGYGQSSYLIVPLVLAVLSFAGVLVFLRLLDSRS
ncbi:monovalent cation/H+ antiporter complex subunit F [Paractinoplanes globisporus]|uniref:Monovalent cation/H+ antiporter complex subunit F n=1 Tax=Paractinoplanes globisporus TaxID=113565 RepID=A0ABW6WC26_9ACTN|nr:monovalent cation/H+ antiporter complex subunit F [Actinoplanes globisporus]